MGLTHGTPPHSHYISPVTHATPSHPARPLLRTRHTPRPHILLAPTCAALLPRAFPRGQVWYEHNDSVVSQVAFARVQQDAAQQGYMLFFANDLTRAATEAARAAAEERAKPESAKAGAATAGPATAGAAGGAWAWVNGGKAAEA